jgi:hypothetical protein
VNLTEGTNLKAAIAGMIGVAMFPCVLVWGAILCSASPRPTNYRATLYDGGQVISAWICHDYGSDGEGVRLTLREGGEVWVRGTLIIEQVPARTEVR